MTEIDFLMIIMLSPHCIELVFSLMERGRIVAISERDTLLKFFNCTQARICGRAQTSPTARESLPLAALSGAAALPLPTRSSILPLPSRGPWGRAASHCAPLQAAVAALPAQGDAQEGHHKEAWPSGEGTGHRDTGTNF